MANSINYDTNDLSGSDFGLTLLSLPFPLWPRPSVDVQVVPYGGGITQGTYYRPLLLSCNVVVEGTSASNLVTRLDNIWQVFDVDSDKVLYFDVTNWNTRQWYARLNNWSLLRFGSLGVFLGLEFIAPNPIAESTTLTEEDHTADDDPFVFPVPG